MSWYDKPFDIFNLNYKKIEKLDGWGELSANNLRKSIEESKNIGLDNSGENCGPSDMMSTNLYQKPINVAKIRFEVDSEIFAIYTSHIEKFNAYKSEHLSFSEQPVPFQ